MSASSPLLQVWYGLQDTCLFKVTGASDVLLCFVLQVTSLEDMRRFILEHSDFSRAQGNVTKHVNIVTQLSEEVSRRNLMEVSSVGDVCSLIAMLHALRSVHKTGDEGCALSLCIFWKQQH